MVNETSVFEALEFYCYLKIKIVMQFIMLKFCFKAHNVDLVCETFVLKIIDTQFGDLKYVFHTF